MASFGKIRSYNRCTMPLTNQSAISTFPSPHLGNVKSLAWLVVSFLSLANSPSVRASELTDAEVSQAIRRLFSDRCYTCHGPDDKTRPTRMRIDRDEVVFFQTESGKRFAVPGNLKESEIWNRINSSDPDTVMPPPKSKSDLNDQQKALVKHWIERGAKYTAKLWAFEALPDKIEVPSLSFGTPNQPGQNPIDAFIESKLQSGKLTKQPAADLAIADLAILARRASLALTGRLPESADVQLLIQSKDPNAYETYVDSLLAAPQFGERAAISWLDRAGYSEPSGNPTDNYFDTWFYRDWVVSAINQDMPYDQFITWQLAGDMLPNPSDQQRLATAFNRLHRGNEASGSTEEDIRLEHVTDRVHKLGKAVMGLTFKRARDPDPKYDSLSQNELIRLCDMFDNVDEKGPTLLLLDKAQKQQMETLEKGIASVRQAYADELKKLEKSDTVEKWYASMLTWPQPENQWLSAEFTFDKPLAESATQIANLIRGDQPGSGEGAIQWQKDGKHSAVLLDGDHALVFPKSGVFSRTQEFTICLDLKVPKSFDRAVVLHRTTSWRDAGWRGYQLLIEDGRFSFDIVHYWPSSAIRIRCAELVPLNQWMQLALVYGGTNRAEETRIYIDGTRVPLEIVQNSLNKDILNEGVDVALSIGARKWDCGLPGGLVDDLQVYDSALTAVEIAGLATDEPWLIWSELTSERQALWREHYAQRLDPQGKYLLESFRHYFTSLAEIVQPARELQVMNELAKDRPAQLLQVGVDDAPGDTVEPGVLQALLSDGETIPKDRLELARWLTSDHHPLTARVAVNHIWQHMFGRGLVVTAEDFGVQGQLPTHPELLDFLARELVRSGWSCKAIFRMISTSRAFKRLSAQ